METDIVLITIAVICLLTGVAGCVLPALPGTSLCFIALVVLEFSGMVDMPTWVLVLWGIVTLVVSLSDYFVPMWGTKQFGGSKYGEWGCIAGSIVGIFAFPPLGILFGPFIGAVLGELLGNKPFEQALKAGVGSFIGFLAGTLIKLIAALGIAICFFVYLAKAF